MNSFMPTTQAAKGKKVNVLFIGNSFTACHDLANVVKAMAEAGNPLKRTFTAKDRADLQRIAWEGLRRFQQATGYYAQR